jgi:hypothetical protein
MMMTLKSKRKAPPRNLLVRFWREFLFTRSIYAESAETPATCVSAIERHLNHKSSGFLDNRRQIVKIVKNHDAGAAYTFTIDAQRRQKRGYGTNAFARGVIWVDEDSGKTIVEGDARFGIGGYIVWFLLVICVSLLFLSEVRRGSGGIFVLVMGGFFTYLLWQMFSDRNRLVDELAQTVHYARPEKPIEAKPVPQHILDWREAPRQQPDQNAAPRNRFTD